MVEKEMLQVSDITQYFYCPRKVYFIKTLGLRIPARHKMNAGKDEHKREHRRIKERKSIYGFPREEVKDVLHRVPVEDPKHHLHGRVDTVVILKNDKIIPVDVKYSSFRNVRRNWKKQLTAYALLLETKFEKEVKRGIIYLPQRREQLEVEISQEDKKHIKKDIRKIIKTIASEKMPPVRRGKKCNYCEMKKFCV